MRAALAVALLLSACGDAVRERPDPGFQGFDPAGLDVECRFVSTLNSFPDMPPVFVTLANDELNGARVNYSGEMLELGTRDGFDPDGGAQVVSYRIQEYGSFGVELNLRPLTGDDYAPQSFEGTVTFVGPKRVSAPIAGSCDGS